MSKTERGLQECISRPGGAISHDQALLAVNFDLGAKHFLNNTRSRTLRSAGISLPEFVVVPRLMVLPLIFGVDNG